MKLFDAHNHLHDERLKPFRDTIIAEAERQGVVKMVVNGSCEEDWPEVRDLARKHAQLILPSFGYHPWYLGERTNEWQKSLLRFLDETPSAVGEIGLDKWILKQRREASASVPTMDVQEEVFVWQLRLATERNLPVSIHCLEAWGKMFDLLRSEPRPQCGFVLHSFA